MANFGFSGARINGPSVRRPPGREGRSRKRATDEMQMTCELSERNPRALTSYGSSAAGARSRSVGARLSCRSVRHTGPRVVGNPAANCLCTRRVPHSGECVVFRVFRV